MEKEFKTMSENIEEMAMEQAKPINEFIKKLKEFADTHIKISDNPMIKTIGKPINPYKLKKEIDKLAGENLI